MTVVEPSKIERERVRETWTRQSRGFKIWKKSEVRESREMEESWGSSYREYVAGLIAGVATVIIGHPFDTVKVKHKKLEWLVCCLNN